MITAAVFALLRAAFICLRNAWRPAVPSRPYRRHTPEPVTVRLLPWDWDT